MLERFKYWIWLGSLVKIAPKKRIELLEYFKDPQAIFEAQEEKLMSFPFITAGVLEQLLNRKIRSELDEVLERLYRLGISVTTIHDEIYPGYLKNIYDPPVVLYYKGSIMADERYIAVVGARKATNYGLSMAERISYELAEYNFNVISGMARGIDTFAHKGALDAGGRTTAVLGCGLDIIYPVENRKLMERIFESGAVISEYLPGTQPLHYNFPARNRIISGVSLGVVVIEAGEKSGSLITADFALEQGREVFAVPGNINSANSTGTNRLIKEGAKMVTGIVDILEELILMDDGCNNKNLEYKNNKSKYIFKGLEIDERRLVECLQVEPLHIDRLSQRCGLDMGMVNSILVLLELKGIVEQLPGKIFKLKL